MDIKVIEKYMKNLNIIDLTEVLNSRLSQSKSYLRILEISYFIEDTNLSILFDIINSIIKSTYIFDNIVLSLCSQVIKVSPKSDITVVITQQP